MHHAIALVDLIKGAISPLQEDDSIHECGIAPLEIIQPRPDDVLSLAHEKLHTWKFSKVPHCWRRLHEEASLWKVVALITAELCISTPHGQKRKRDDTETTQVIDTVKSSTDEDCITKVVYILDMTLILTGAPLRRNLIMQVLDSLNPFLDSVPVSMTATFPPAAVPTSHSDTFTRLGKMDFLSFQEHLDKKPEPIVLSGLLDDWPAVADKDHAWDNPQYLLESTLGGRRLVPVELGRSYTDQGWSQKIMTFREYMESYLLQPKQAQVGYLAQHDLFQQIPSLAADTRTPDLCYTSPPPPDPAYRSTVPVQSLEEPLRNAWLGPAGTISPLHTDPYHNILCQVVGYKYIRLYAPSETPKLYPRGIDEAGVNMENTSYVDISVARKLYPSPITNGVVSIDQNSGDYVSSDEIQTTFDAQYPLFKYADYIEGILGPGECLYIPVGWWHYVESLSTSFSMSFWWS